MPKCPSCSSRFRKRLSRSFLLKLIPKAKLYSCHDCKSRFVKVPYFFNAIVLKKSKAIENKIASS